MDLPDLIESFGALGKRTARHSVTCNCTECSLFMEIADTITQQPTKEINHAVRELAERRVTIRKAA